MTTPLLFKKPFQLGYAVRDVDQAIASLSGKFGVSKWQIMRLPENAPARALAFAYVGDMMIELIDIKPGQVEVFNEWVPQDDAALQIHHLGYLVDDEEEFRTITERYAEIGIAKVVDLEMGDILAYRYFDTVALLGHYSEYVLLKSQGKDFWAHVPNNA